MLSTRRFNKGRISTAMPSFDDDDDKAGPGEEKKSDVIEKPEAEAKVTFLELCSNNCCRPTHI
jgi:hypothetical protein